MRSKTGVLVAIKVFQLIGGVSCLVFHIHAYTSGLNLPHITVFCGTYMGFTLVNLAFLASAVLGKPAAEELDMAFGVLGSCLFYVCGVLGMFYVRQEQLEEQKATGSLTTPEAYDLNPHFFNIARGQAVVSLMTALSFVFDACLKFDMWKYDLDLRRNKLAPDAFDPPDLRLFCFEICIRCHRHRKRRRQHRQQTHDTAEVRPRSPPAIFVEDEPEPLRDAAASPEPAAQSPSPRLPPPIITVEEPSLASESEYDDAPWMRFLRPLPSQPVPQEAVDETEMAREPPLPNIQPEETRVRVLEDDSESGTVEISMSSEDTSSVGTVESTSSAPTVSDTNTSDVVISISDEETSGTGVRGFPDTTRPVPVTRTPEGKQPDLSATPSGRRRQPDTVPVGRKPLASSTKGDARTSRRTAPRALRATQPTTSAPASQGKSSETFSASSSDITTSDTESTSDYSSSEESTSKTKPN